MEDKNLKYADRRDLKAWNLSLVMMGVIQLIAVSILMRAYTLDNGSGGLENMGAGILGFSGYLVLLWIVPYLLSWVWFLLKVRYIGRDKLDKSKIVKYIIRLNSSFAIYCVIVFIFFAWMVGFAINTAFIFVGWYVPLIIAPLMLNSKLKLLNK